MSSGIESTLLYQIGDVINLLQEKERDRSYVSGILSGVLQGIIGDDEIIIRPKGAEMVHLVSNFQSAAEAINAGNYPVKWGLAEKPAEISMIIQPVDCRVRRVPLGKVMTTEQIYNIPRIVDPIKLLTFGFKCPKAQEKESFVTVWLDASGRFWFAVLGVFDDERHVHINRLAPGAEWRSDGCVLVCE